MQIALVSLFPEMFAAVSDHGVTGRAVRQGLLELSHRNPRDFTSDRHRTVDDRPYGGGPGMVMMIDPLQQAIAAARAALGGDAKVIFLSPQGRRFDHRVALELAREPALVLIAGRYEGVDERLLQAEVDEELSIGDYVLSGGELAAMVVIDAITRQLPGALGHELSAQEDSFADGLLDCPHYTRPEVYQGRQVPEVLLSGNHEEIRRWRLKQALGRTRERRPDLLEGRALTPEEEQLLADYLRQRDTSTDNQL
jgi:tRNA (guanine37-N1)-methyltransferase